MGACNPKGGYDTSRSPKQARSVSESAAAIRTPQNQLFYSRVSWSKKVSSTFVFKDGEVICPPQSLLLHCHKKLEFFKFVEGPSMYRLASDSPLGLHYSRQKMSKGKNLKWKNAIRCHPYYPRCSETLLHVLVALPERVWSLEWKDVRDECLELEEKFRALQTEVSTSDTDSSSSSPSSKQVQRSLLLALMLHYRQLEEIQEHFNWASSIVFDAITNRLSQGKFISALCMYYKSCIVPASTSFQSKEPAASISIHRQQRLSDSEVALVDEVSMTFYRILRHNFELENNNNNNKKNHNNREPLLERQRDILLAAASTGFEFMGIHFLLVKNLKSWKLCRREAAFSRRLLFEPEHPCPPLINLLDSFSCCFCATAVIPTSFSDPIIPVQYPPKLLKSSLECLRMASKEKYAESLVRFFPPLPNPGRYLSTFAPSLVLLTSSEHISPIQRLTASLMCLGRSESLPNTSLTNSDIEQFATSLSLISHILAGEKLNPYGGPVAQCNAKDFSLILTSLDDSRSGSIALRRQSSFLDSVRYLAIAFKSNFSEPAVRNLGLSWDPRKTIRFAAEELECDVSAILPYAPVVEDDFYDEEKDHLFKAEIFGFRCAVWTQSVCYSPQGSLHTLNSVRPSKRGAPLFTLKEVPWGCSNFVLVVEPTEVFLRPEYVLISAPIPSIMEIVSILTTALPCVRSSTDLHRFLHRHGLPVGLSVWAIYAHMLKMHSMSSNERAIFELIVCDLVSGAIKRVVRFHTCDESRSPQLGLEKYTVEVLLAVALNIELGLHEVVNLQNAKRYLHLAIWIPLLGAAQHLNICVCNDMVANMLHMVRSSQRMLLKCMMDRFGYQFNADAISHLPKRLSDEHLSIASSMSFQQSPRSLSAPSPHESELSKASSYFGESMELCLGPTRLKPKSTFTIRDFLLKVLIAKALTIGDLSILKSIAQITEFADSFALPTVAKIVSESCSKPAFDMSIQLISIDFFLDYVRLESAIISPEITMTCLRMALLVCFDIALKRLSGSSSSPLDDPCEVVVTMAQRFMSHSEPKIPVNLLVAWLIVKALFLLVQQNDVTTTQSLLHNALRILIEVWGDAREAHCIGFPACLYLSWILAMLSRYRQQHSLAAWYEEFFRATRLSSPCCPLPLRTLQTRLNGNSSSLSDHEIVIQIMMNHKCLDVAAIEWIHATSPLNCGTMEMDIISNHHGWDFTKNVKTLQDIGLELSHESALLLLPSVVCPASRHKSILSLGSNACGELGLGTPCRPEHLDGTDILSTSEPTTIVSFKDDHAMLMASGCHHCLALTASGEVYAWGDNTFGQTGISCTNLKKSANLCKGSCPVAQLTWIMGDSTTNGTVKHDPTENFKFVPLPTNVAFSVSMKSIHCGGDFSAAVTISHLLYTWGCNKFGQLGLGDYDDRDRPQLVEVLKMEETTVVSCGKCHVGAITAVGELWTWGRGTEGQLGVPYTCLASLGDLESSSNLYRSWGQSSMNRPKCTLTNSAAAGKLHFNSKEAVGCLSSPQKIRVFQFSEEIDVWKNDRINELNLTPASNDTVVWRQDPFSKEFVASLPNECAKKGVQYSEEVEFLTLACGDFHTIAIDICNCVWTWGNNDDGQLGIGDTAQVAAESDRWMILEKCNNTPNDSHGKLERGARWTPCKLCRSQFDNMRIEAVFAGLKSSAALDEHLGLWTWGTNEYEALASGDKNIRKQSTPQRALLFANQPIVCVSYGSSGDRFGVVDSAGEVCLWGVSKSGCLGPTNDSTPPEPHSAAQTWINPSPGNFKTLSGDRIVGAVALGFDHTLVFLLPIEESSKS